MALNLLFAIYACYFQIMRKILGTHLGHSALFQMITVLKDPKYAGKPTLLRGAVFNISMGMWGGQKVASLNTTACTVLPAFMEVKYSFIV